MNLPTELNHAQRWVIVKRIEEMAELLKEAEDIRHRVQGLVDNAVESISVNGESDAILGGNLYRFRAGFRQETNPIVGMSATLTNLLHDWQLKTMKFNKETGEWE